jgi:RNA polymerase sigma-70 factor, ECF subfamily
MFSFRVFTPYTWQMANLPPDTDSSSDEFLLAQVALGNEAALTTLYQRFSRRVHSLARRILGSQSEADDITQEVFVKLWERAGGFFEQRGSAAAWLMTIAHHASIDALRRRTTRRIDNSEETLERFSLEPTQDPLEQAMLSRALEVLTKPERELIELAFFDGFSHSQIAKKTELPLGTIKSRLRLGLEKLAKALGANESSAHLIQPQSNTKMVES